MKRAAILIYAGAVLAGALAAFAVTRADAQTLRGQVVAGSDNGTTARTLLTDSSGRLQVIGAAAGGVAYGPDNPNGAGTQAPIRVGGSSSATLNSGTVYNWVLNSSGAGTVVGALTSGTSVAASPGFMIGGTDGTNYRSLSVTTGGALNVGSIASALPTGANTIGSVNAIQSGTWTVQPGNTANTTPWLVGGNVTAADGTTLAGALKGFAIGGLYNGVNIDIQRDILAAQTGGAGVTAVAVQPVSAAGAAITPVVSPSVQSGLVLKASAGNLYRVAVTTGATQGFLLVFNSTTVPADGAVTPLLCRVAPANSSTEVDHSQLPQRYSTGISVAFSTTGCFTKTASATAMFEGDVQ